MDISIKGLDALPVQGRDGQWIRQGNWCLLGKNGASFYQVNPVDPF